MIKPIKYFHCFKLNDANYALFDSKMDTPLMVGTLNILKQVQLPENSLVFYYEIKEKGCFQKSPAKTIDIHGTVIKTKPPLRFNTMSKLESVYHHFKLSPTLSVLFDSRFNFPITYGSNSKIQATINNIPKQATIIYYKEDAAIKNSFKFFMLYKGKEIKAEE